MKATGLTISRSKPKNDIRTPLHIARRLVAIGASTGGPGVIKQILTGLPESFDIPIIIVQHIQQAFIDGFVTWLGADLNRPVLLAKEGQEPESGCIYLASTAGNLSLNDKFQFHYSSPLATQLYTPNIDHLFSNLANLSLDATAIILTGMGSDGAIGLKDLAGKGWITYVQSSDSCVVSGMPDAALKLSRRHQVGSPHQIGQFLHTFGLASKKKEK